ncbi:MULTISPECIES: hypothetical protein [unclassified Microcoleus]|uniref:hypothetical protein n=1 Tax=unclassified Microcoleus TaxID=2642155 RepID=UPI002FD1CC22
MLATLAQILSILKYLLPDLQKKPHFFNLFAGLNGRSGETIAIFGSQVKGGRKKARKPDRLVPALNPAIYNKNNG